MKISHTITLAATSAALAISAPAHAQQQDSTIFVQPTTTEAEYVAHVSEQLNRQLSRIEFPLTARPVGVVRVLFTANAEGEAENVTLIGNARNNQLNRAALRAIGRLDDVAPGAGEDRQIQANIIFALTDRQAARMAERLQAEEEVRIAAARARGEAPVLALTLSATALSR